MEERFLSLEECKLSLIDEHAILNKKKEATPRELAELFNDGFALTNEYLLILDYNFFMNYSKKNFTVAAYKEIQRSKDLISSTPVHFSVINHVSIFAHLVYLIHDTPTELDATREISYKFGASTTPAAHYFKNCLFFDKNEQHFKCSQFPAKEGSELISYQRLPLKMRQDLIPCPHDAMQEILDIGLLIQNIEAQFELYKWSLNSLITNFESITQLYDQLTPFLSEIQNRLILFNKKMNGGRPKHAKKELINKDMSGLTVQEEKQLANPVKEIKFNQSHIPLNEIVEKLYSVNHSTSPISTINIAKKRIQGRLLHNQKLLEILRSNAFLNTDKLSLIPRTTSIPDFAILYLLRMIEKQVDVYNLSLNELGIEIKNKKDELNRNSNLYVLFGTHLKSLEIEKSLEIIHTELLITFFHDLASTEARQFVKCMSLTENIKDGDRRIIYSLKVDNLSTCHELEYYKLAESTKLLLDEKKIEDALTISDLLIRLKTDRNIYSENIQIKLENISNTVSSIKKASELKKVYINLLRTFNIFPSICTEHENLYRGQIRILDAALQNEEAYKEIKIREKTEREKKVESKEEELIALFEKNEEKDLRKAKKVKKAAPTRMALSINDVRTNPNSMLPIEPKSNSSKIKKHEEKKNRQLLKTIENEIDALFGNVFTFVDCMQDEANDIIDTLLQNEMNSISTDALEGCNRAKQEEKIRQYQISLLLGQMISKVEERPYIQDEIAHILCNVFKEIKCNAQNAEYDTIMEMFRTKFRLVGSADNAINSKIKKSLSICMYERVEQKKYSKERIKAESIDACLRAQQIENALDYGRWGDGFNQKENEFSYLKEYKYCRSWLRPYLVTPRFHPITEFPLNTLDVPHYKMLMMGLVNTLNSNPTSALKKKANNKIHGYTVTYHHNNAFKYFRTKKTFKGFSTEEINKNSSNQQSYDHIGSLFIEENTLVMLNNMICEERFYTAAQMFVSQLTHSTMHPYHYWIQQEKDWNPLLSEIEQFIFYANSYYEQAEKLTCEKPPFLNELLTRFTKFVTMYQDLKTRHLIKNYKQTWCNFLHAPKNQDEVNKIRKGKEAPSFNIYNEFLLYFFNTPDDKIWNEKYYYADFDNLRYTYSTSVIEYNSIPFQLQNFPEFQQTLNTEYAKTLATAQPQETKSSQQQCSQDVQEQLSHYESSCL